MKLSKLWLATILGAQLAFTSLAADGTSDTNRDADIEALKQQLRELSQKVQALESQRAVEQQAATNIANAQVQELDQKVRILARERELDQEAAAALAKTQPKLSIGPGGLTASSADSNFVFSLKGVIQVDDRTFLDNSGAKGNDGLLLRRARPIFQGTLYRDFDFVFIPDFGGSSVQIFDAYANYRYEPWAQLRVGKFKTPVGLEQLQADVNTSFNERSLVTDLVPNRDVGVQLWGDINGGVLSYAVGIFNGVGDFRNSSNANVDNDGEFAGRLFSLPFKNSDITALQNLGFGVAGSSGNTSRTAAGLPSTTGGTLPGYTTDGQQQFFAYNPATGAVVANGNHWRLSPQGYYYYGPLSLLGEYAISDQGVLNTGTGAQAHLQNTAWEISGGWVLTGENASFNGITPLHPFDPHKGQWGALQVVARYAELNIDDDAFPVFANPATSASAAQAWSAGLNWYLNKNIRLNASYSRTTFTGGGGTGTTAPAVTTRQPESVFFTRVQLAF
ncbi:MAG TPA: porin [Verrucomicrobiae bacterium]|nr:porin [Verrucomicrobiae bacterium]